jgi:energy-converting hydrogenase B subunit D
MKTAQPETIWQEIWQEGRMSSMIIVITLGVLMIIGSLAALYMKNMVSAIITVGSVSLLASLIYLILGAPDVAMTEAAIGAALTAVVFLFAWSRIRDMKKENREND